MKYATRRARLASDAFAIEHQRYVMDRLKQHSAYEATKPLIDCLPRTKVSGQHPPATAAACHVADCIQHLTKVHAHFSTALGWLGKQRLHALPFVIPSLLENHMLEKSRHLKAMR
jgi:hypothetical protein